MWKFLNSRKVAVYLLTLFLGMLLCSAFVPSPYTVSPEQWQQLQQQGGLLFWAYSHLSTPFLVKNPAFAAISLLLFLSTLVCTVERGRQWWSSRSYEFAKEKAFSFSVAENSRRGFAELQGEIESLLASARWKSTVERGAGSAIFSGDKGMSGFWGSMVFHLGLLVCFLAAPVTLVSGYKGALTLLEDDAVPALSVIAQEGSAEAAGLKGVTVKVSSLRGEFFQGKYRQDFGGRISFEEGGAAEEFPFAVNHPVSHRGFQFSLNSFGYAPHLVIKGGGGSDADSYVSVSNAAESNYFALSQDLRAFVLFFPDFIREGDKIGTRSKNAVNPVTMVKLYRGEREVFKGLFRPGEQSVWEGKTVSVPDFKHWVTFSVTREYGIVLVMAGFVLVVAGLFARFLSNERRIELEIGEAADGTSFRVRGYSRYYPAFLEKEVLQIAERLR